MFISVNENMKELEFKIYSYKFQKSSPMGFVPAKFEVVTEPVGKLLLDFLEIDLGDITKIMEKYFNIGIPSNYSELDSNINLVFKGIDELRNIHPYLICDIGSLMLDLAYYKELSEKNIEAGYHNPSIKDKKAIQYVISSINSFIKVSKSPDYGFDLHNSFNMFDKNEILLYVDKTAISIDTIRMYIEYCYIKSPFPEFEVLSPSERLHIIEEWSGGMLGQNEFSSRMHLFNAFDSDDYDLSSKEDRIKLVAKVQNTRALFENVYNLSIDSILVLEMILLFKNKIKVNKCSHCSKYFIPESREDEKYCNRIKINGRTCKQMGWEQKLKSKHYEAYRKVYLKFVPFKERNKENFNKFVSEDKIEKKLLKGDDKKIDYHKYITLEDIFDLWNKSANFTIFYLDENEDLSPAEYEEHLINFNRWLDRSYKEIKRFVQEKISEEELDFIRETDRKGVKTWLENL